MSADLAGWLRQVLDAREREAQMLLADAKRIIRELKEPRLLGKEIPGWGKWPDVERLARLTLAEVAATRAVLDRHILKAGERVKICAECGGREWKPGIGHNGLDAHPWVMPWPCPTIRLLAQPYTDRPGFRDEWRHRDR